MELVYPTLNTPPRENTEQSPSTQDGDASKAYSTDSMHPESAFEIADLAGAHEKVRRASRLSLEWSASAESRINLQDSSDSNYPITPFTSHDDYMVPLVAWSEREQSNDSRYDFANPVPRSLRQLM